MRTLIPLLALALSGCGIIAGNTGCDLRIENAANGYEDRCQERTGFQGNALYGEFCTALGGIDIEGGCPTEDVVGGCESNLGSGKVIDWYYAPGYDAASAEAECEGEGKFVTP